MALLLNKWLKLFKYLFFHSNSFYWHWKQNPKKINLCTKDCYKMVFFRGDQTESWPQLFLCVWGFWAWMLSPCLSFLTKIQKYLNDNNHHHQRIETKNEKSGDRVAIQPIFQCQIGIANREISICLSVSINQQWFISSNHKHFWI